MMIGKSICLLIVAFIGSCSIAIAGPHVHDHSKAKLQYVQNNGQWDATVDYQVSFSGAKMFLQDDGVLWVRLEDGASTVVHDVMNDPTRSVTDLTFQAHAWKMKFIDAAPDVVIKASEQASQYHNYFLGDDPTRWAGKVPVFAEVTYEKIWDGVDMRWYGDGPNVKYDLIIEPKADFSRIKFSYEGLDVPLRLKDGDLVITTSVATLTEMHPVAWYADDKSELACVFTLKDGVVGFDFPNGVDTDRPIVIDPLLVGATYSGMVGDDIYGHCATYDDAGNIYSGGQAFGPGLPASVGAFQATFGGGFGTDINVNKFTPNATAQIFATYIGGLADDKPHSLIVNAAQQLCILGSANGAGYPTTASAFSPTFNGGSSDIVVTRLNAGGTAMIGSTYMGGSNDDGRQNFNPNGNYGDTYRGEVMLDAAGNTFVISSSTSTNFPVSPGAFQSSLAGGQDAVVFGLTPDCSNLVWSTYFGGSQDDNGLGMRFFGNGDVVLVGGTSSSDLPNNGNGWNNAFLGGAADAYVATLTNNGGTLLASSYIGTSDSDVAQFVDLDSNEDVYVYGQSGGGMPIMPAGTYGQAGGNIFVVKLDQDLSAAQVTTSLGPTGGFGFSLVPVAFLVDVCDQIYISGFNPETGWSTTVDALYPTGGFSDFYLAVYDVDLSGLKYATFYGGSHVDGGTSRFDKNGIVYQGVCSGGQSMPTSPGAFAPVNNVGWDIGVFKIDLEQAGVQAYVNTNQPAYGCVPATFDFTASGSAVTYTWDLGDGSPLVTDTVVSHTYTQAGTYIVTLIGSDPATCNLADTTFYTLVVNEPGSLDPGFTAQQSPDCSVFEIILHDTTGGAWIISTWDMGDGTMLTGNPISHQYPSAGTYNVTLFVNDTICVDSSQITLPVTLLDDGLQVDLGADEVICTGQSVTLSAPFPGGTYLWSTNETTQTIVVSDPGTYWVNVDINGCAGSDTLLVALAPVPAIVGFTAQSCPGVPVGLTIPVDGASYQWQNGSTDQSITVDSIGDYLFTVTDQYGCTYQDTAHVLTYEGAFDMVIPNVISPNGDGVNDHFEPQTNGFQDVEVTIYNRWGMEMFSHPNLSRLWNGKHDGKGKVSDGTYFYIVKYRNSCEDTDVVETGHVTVLR